MEYHAPHKIVDGSSGLLLSPAVLPVLAQTIEDRAVGIRDYEIFNSANFDTQPLQHRESPVFLHQELDEADKAPMLQAHLRGDLVRQQLLVYNVFVMDVLKPLPVLGLDWACIIYKCSFGVRLWRVIFEPALIMYFPPCWNWWSQPVRLKYSVNAWLAAFKVDLQIKHTPSFEVFQLQRGGKKPPK